MIRYLAALLISTGLLVSLSAHAGPAAEKAKQRKAETKLQKSFEKRCDTRLSTSIDWKSFKDWPANLSVSAHCDIGVAFSWLCSGESEDIYKEAVKKYDKFVCKVGTFPKEKNCDKRMNVSLKEKTITLETNSQSCNLSNNALTQLTNKL